MQINKHPFRVIGVVAADHIDLARSRRPDVWIPLAQVSAYRPAWMLNNRNSQWLNIGGRRSRSPSVAWKKAPRMPARFKTAAQVARFKRQQREFDHALIDMALSSPQSIQDRNSVVPSRQAIRLIDFDKAHAAAV